MRPERRDSGGRAAAPSARRREPGPMIVVREVESEEDVAALRTLAGEYVATLGFDLDFQDFERELESLPGDYAPPGGCALLAEHDGEAAGCVGLRPFSGDVCEMKRLYVRPGYRGQGVGRLLAEEILMRAKAMGYGRMRLDTIDTMTEANALYRSLGFVEIPPYRHNPIDGAIYFELELQVEL